MDSVLGQGRRELEYILVDPGSSDGSRELIESRSSELAAVIFEKDCGPADGLNKGFARATGEIFAFLNSDDYLLPGSLGKVAAFFEENRECEMLFANGYVVDASGKPQRLVKARDFTVSRYFHSGARFLQQSTFFRRSAFECAGGFNAANHTCWDGELFVRMVKQGASVGYLDAELSAFRVHSGSITGSGRLTKAYLSECSRIFREVEGREWGLRDDLLNCFYRAEGAAKKICSILDRKHWKGQR